jgi:RimJ/RimL family protein N-acetyltransferase
VTTPSISTARLSLRPFTKATGRNIAWLRDPDVVRFSEQRHRTHTLSSQLRYINSFGGDSHLWAIYLVENGEHIGNISAMHDAPNNVSEVGLMIGETKFWGKGFGGEAWSEVCRWLLDKDCGHIRKLEAGCARNNEAMLKIIRGSGFTQEGELLNHFQMEGGPISALLFGRMR